MKVLEREGHLGALQQAVVPGIVLSIAKQDKVNVIYDRPIPAQVGF